jgi:hypothetical protein
VDLELRRTGKERSTWEKSRFRETDYRGFRETDSGQIQDSERTESGRFVTWTAAKKTWRRLLVSKEEEEGSSGPERVNRGIDSG